MIQITVNGAGRRFGGEHQMPLLWYLGDVLELTGTKFGCGIGQCRAGELGNLVGEAASLASHTERQDRRVKDQFAG